MKFITIYVKLIDPKGKPVQGQITIRNGYAMSVFSDKKLAKALFEADDLAGKAVAYNEKYNAYVQRFKGLPANLIKLKISKEIKEAGGTEFTK